MTVLQGIQSELEGKARVMFSEGCDLCRDRVENLAQPNDRISEAVAIAKASDAVVLVVVLDETLEGEEWDEGNSYKSGDKNDLLLPQCQRILVDRVLEVGKPTVIVLLAGSSVDLGSAADKAGAVLLGWYPGAMGGKAIAEILFGKVSPSGKLPVTFYHQSDLYLMPDFTDYSMRGRTYRYFRSRPLYPFGYGLTYSKVRICGASFERTEGGLEVRIRAENSGKTLTGDVVQIYAQNEGSNNAPDNPRLVAFRRIELGPGQIAELTLKVSDENLMVVNERGESVKEGRVVLYAGTCQPDAYSLELSGTDVIRMEVN